MWINLVLIIYALHIFIHDCCGLRFIELPGYNSDNDAKDPPKTRDIEAEKPYDANNDFANKAGYEKHVENNDWKTREPYPKLRSQNEAKYREEIHNDDKHKNEKQQRIDDDIHQAHEKSEQVRRYWLVTKTGTRTTRTSLSQTTTTPCDRDSKLKEKIAKLVQTTLEDTEKKMKNFEKLKDQYRDKLPYKIGFILNMIKKSNDMLNELFNMAVKHRNEWKALEQMKTFESIVHTNVDTTHLVRQLVEFHIQQINSTNNENPNDKKKRVVLL